MKKLFIVPLVLGLLALKVAFPRTAASDGTQGTVSAGPSNEAVAPSFETTIRMRDAAGREVDWGSKGAQINEKVFTNDAAALTRMFRNDEGAVMCQGAAYYLHLLYLEAGFRSYLVGFKCELFSHAMVLVEIQAKDGTRKLVVQDPTFNLTYVDSAGEPLSIFQIISEIAAGKHESIVVQEGLRAEVDFLQASVDPDPTGSLYIDASSLEASKNGRFMKYSATISLAAYATMLRKEVSAFTSSRGLGDSILYAIFGEPTYVYKRYPMTDEEQKEADNVFHKLVMHHARVTGARYENERSLIGMSAK